MKRVLELKNIKEIRLMTDPYRMEILRIFRHFDRPVTVKEIADEMGEVHGKVYYHVKKMIDFDAIKLVKTEKINGIVAKFYELNFDRLYVVADENDDEKKQRSAYKGLINQFFNDYRDMYLESIDKVPSGESTLSKSSLIGGELHFSEASFEKFCQEIVDLTEQYMDKKETDTFKKQLFYAYFTSPRDL